MCRFLPVLACLALAGFVRGEEYSFPGQTSDQPKYLGGLQISRSGGQTVFSLGGPLLPRRVKVVEATPDGPVVTRFTLPAQFHSPVTPPFDLINPLGPRPSNAPAIIRLQMPQEIGVVYIEGVRVPSRGLVRLLESPPLPPTRATVIQVRIAYLAGDHVMIEDRPIALRGGETSNLTFDGSRAIVVPIDENR